MVPLSLMALGLLANALVAAPAGVTVSAPAITPGDPWLLDTDPTHDAVSAQVAFNLSRNQPGEPARDIPFRLTLRLVESGAGGIALGSISHTQVVTVAGVVANLPVSLDLEITPASVLSQDQDYEINLTLSHIDDPPGGTFQVDHTVTDGPHRFVHFSGALSFGRIDTTMSGFSLPPFELPVRNGWRLRISEGSLSNGVPYFNAPPSTSVVDVQRNDATGDASVLLGSVLVAVPDDTISINEWTGQLGPVLLDPDGFHAEGFTLNLPEGVGWRLEDADPGTPQTLNPVFDAGDTDLPLNELLQPLGSVSGTFAAAHEFVDERLAVGFIGTGWTWDRVTLNLVQPATRFQRAWHYDQWQAVKGDLPDANDGYLDQLAPSSMGDLRISPGLGGGLNTGLSFGNGVFSTHFPHGFVAHTGGALNLTNSQPNTTNSSLKVATTTVITYIGCRPEFDPHGSPPGETLEAVQVGPGTLRFTAQGSLWTEGVPVADPNPLDEIPIVRRAAAGLDESGGLPVHETADYAGRNVQMLIPGATVPAADGFDRADDANAAVDEPGEHPGEFNPARWLYTGLRPGENDALEHPATLEYYAGDGDFAGVNFRHFVGLTGISRIGGGEMGPYALESCQKLYARASGVTGRWVADAGSLPPSVQIGGPDPFTVRLDAWAFQLVGNEPQFENSAVAGSVVLPYPADFALAFDSIEFSCCGNLERVSLVGGESVKQLAYWRQARIAIQSAQFVSAEQCSMADSCLELHVRARANGFPQDLDGILLFRGSGRMTTGQDAPHPGSALHVSSGSPFAGDYHVEPVRHGYYNDPISTNTPAEGFINVAGLLDVPFFLGMGIHAILSGTDLPPVVNPDIIPGLQGGWGQGGETFFSNADFDAAHRGLPPAFDAPDEYLASQAEGHLPRARRTWFGVVPFDFPVVYDAPTRHFHSVEPKSINVIIADADADVPWLNHEQAAIDFGITVGLNLNNLLSEALSFASGELAEGFAHLAIGPAFDAIGEGLDELDELLSLQAREALGEPILPALEAGIIQQAASQIQGGADVNTALNQIAFNGALQNLLASDTAAFVTDKLGPINEGLEGMRSFLAPGQETQLGQFMQQAMGFLNLPPGLNNLTVPDIIELTGVEAGPLRDRIEELRARMQELIGLVQDVTGLEAELQGLLSGANADFSNAQTDVRNALQSYFATVHAEPGVYTQAEIETRIRAEIEARLWAMPVMSSVQTELRSRFYHFDHLIRQVLSSALDQLNRAVMDVASAAVDLDGTLGNLTGIGGYVQAASLRGEAVVTGDDLTYLSLKGHTVIQTEPIPFNFDPFYEYQQLHTDGEGACDPAAQPAVFNRITMGATVSPARFTLGDVNVTISTEFSFTEDYRIIGFAGAFETLQEGLQMQPVNFDRINALLNIGGDTFDDFEFYIAAEGHATLFSNPSPIQLPYSNFKLHGGLFAGRTCSDAPYAAWAPDHVVNQFTEFPITGAIAAVDGKFPFYDVGCLLRLKAGASVGAFGVAQAGDLAVGAFLGGNVSGDFLCLIHGEGSILLQGVASSSGASMSGDIEAKLKIGPCPFCVTLDPTFGVTLSTDGGVEVDF